MYAQIMVKVGHFYYEEALIEPCIARIASLKSGQTARASFHWWLIQPLTLQRMRTLAGTANLNHAWTANAALCLRTDPAHVSG